MKRASAMLGLLGLLAGLSGCAPTFGPRAAHGITFYCPGAGVDLGDAGVRAGLERAGYQGQVARVTWSISLNPAIDQTLWILSQQGGKRLAGYIQEYIDRYPGREVNIVGLSAGTGVAVWALESLKPGYEVNNVILLASSLSYDYDVTDAAERVKGRIYNYYSPSDAVLAGPMKLAGTIDRKFFIDGAGAVGIVIPPGLEHKIVNIPWREDFAQFGYHGGHMESTNARFVEAVLAGHILSANDSSASAPQTAYATRTATPPPDARPD